MTKNIKIKKNTLPISIVIPIFNNENTIPENLNKCINLIQNNCNNYEIIISNDASSDNSKNILDNFKNNSNIKIFHQNTNKGISNNIKFLYNKARFEYILLFSIDGAWNVMDILKLINATIKNKADIVIGERKNKAYSFTRLLISKFYNYLIYLLFGVNTYDAGSIKIFKKYLLKGLISKSIFFEAEMIIRSKKNNLKIYNISVDHKHIENKKSGVNLLLIFDALIDLIKYRIITL